MDKLLTILLTFFSSVIVAQPKISFTFDDGATSDRAQYAFEDWNSRLLRNLEIADVKAYFFVTGFNKTDEKGELLLESWNLAGHKIANHTISHPNYNSNKTTFEKFSNEFLFNDTIINKFNNYARFFRFPYLKEGNTLQKVKQFRELLKKHGYRNGHVTIDASDWYIDSRLVKRLKENPKADLDGFKAYYLKHLFDRAKYYEKLSFELMDRHINHTMLLHHNLAAALFLDDLIDMFKARGWLIIDADEAYNDEIYLNDIDPEYAGESLVWGLAKKSGKYDDILRYPAEGQRYEQAKMDALGL